MIKKVRTGREPEVSCLPSARTYERDEGGVYFAESHASDLAPRILDFIVGLPASN